MSVETMARLAELPNVVGVKDATADLGRPTRTRAAIGEEFCQLSGEDGTILGFVAQGGDGCISVTANVAPRQCAGFFAAWERGDADEALDRHTQLMPLHDTLFVESNPIPGQVCRVAPRQVRAGDEASADLPERGQSRADRSGNAPGRRPQLSAALGQHLKAGSAP